MDMYLKLLSNINYMDKRVKKQSPNKPDWFCPICDRLYKKSSKYNHLKTKKHKNNLEILLSKPKGTVSETEKTIKPSILIKDIIPYCKKCNIYKTTH